MINKRNNFPKECKNELREMKIYLNAHPIVTITRYRWWHVFRLEYKRKNQKRKKYIKLNHKDVEYNEYFFTKCFNVKVIIKIL